jgi:dCMP deaminase
MFAGIAAVISLRSTCTRAKVGAIIVKNNRIISTGYVGSPPGEDHCLDHGCLIGEHGGCVRTIHAEVNAINFARLNGVNLKGAELYCTLSPCENCAEEIVKAGITVVHFNHVYRKTEGIELLSKGGVGINHILYKE